MYGLKINRFQYMITNNKIFITKSNKILSY